jgi:hypothetical protein
LSAEGVALHNLASLPHASTKKRAPEGARFF